MTWPILEGGERSCCIYHDYVVAWFLRLRKIFNSGSPVIW
ncbi:hypothetical protein BVRB_5g122050 [Beta vulgaris subsp. vulgaris]|nr:hypothetical protein BVRB_5g122050 [Beta vulgaris subsp. vulgaris]